MKSHHHAVADLYRALARSLPDDDRDLAIRALAAALRDLANRHYASPTEARTLSVAALRDAFATEVSEIATFTDICEQQSNLE